MNKGILVFAYNNSEIDYIQQACFLAKSVKKYLNLPLSVITDVMPEKKYINFFDKIIIFNTKQKSKNKIYRDGSNIEKPLEFKNMNRANAYSLTPYDETILMDTDIILNNNIFLNCFQNIGNFLIYDTSPNLNYKIKNLYQNINDKGIKFYWASVIYFKKTEINKIFFNLIEHIKDNWDHYKLIYGITQSYYRNDYAFSIAIHIMNRFSNHSFVGKMPGKLFHTTDRDFCINISQDGISFLLEKSTSSNDFFVCSTKNLNVHVMNKFSLSRCILNYE